MKSDEEKSQNLYIERDISWMYFNHRILLEATRPEVPILERLTFLGIYSNNLDEFFRVRVATLNRIVEYADKNIKKEQNIATQTLKQIGKLHNRYCKQFEDTFATITEDLKQENIYIVKETELSIEQGEFINFFYRNQLNGSTIRFSLPIPVHWVNKRMKTFILLSALYDKPRKIKLRKRITPLSHSLLPNSDALSVCRTLKERFI